MTHTLPELTARERAVLDCIGRGMTFPRAGAELNLSPSTIKAYANRLRFKFGVQTARELAPFARDYENA